MRFLLKMNKFVDYNNFVDSPQLRDFSITPTVWNHRSVAILDYTNDVESKSNISIPEKGTKETHAGEKTHTSVRTLEKGTKENSRRGKKKHTTN